MINSPSAEEETPSKGDSNQVEEEKETREEESEDPAESDKKVNSEKAPASDSSSELDNSCDSESLDLQLSAVDVGPLHIEEEDDSESDLNKPQQNGLENGEVSGMKDLRIPHKVRHLISTQLREDDANLLCVFK